MVDFQLKNDAFVSVSEINNVISFCSERGNELISIHFEQPVSRIDIVFVGGLFLLYKQKHLKFILGGVCGQYHDAVFDVNSKPQDFLQYSNQIKSLYSPEEDWLAFTGSSEVVSNEVRAPRVYAPILFVDKDELGPIFDQTNEELGRLKESYIRKLGEANKTEKAYFEKKDSIIIRLKEHSPIYSFVFSILYYVNNPFIKKRDDPLPIINPEKTIDSIWDFTIQFVSGLLELAKNIVSHSEFKMGIITIRAYEEIIGEETCRMLNTFVLDLGTRGIIPTMIDELRQQENRTKEDDDDLMLLSSGQFGISDLFQKSDNLLFRQIRREMAHLGLIHFSALIRARDGAFMVSSPGLSGENEPYGDNSAGDVLGFGTNFHFTLPLKRYKEEDLHTPSNTNSSSSQVGLSMSELLNKKDKIQVVSLPNMRVRTRDDELALIQKLPPQEEDKDYYVINFEETDLLATSMLRVLACVSRKINIALIAYNLETEMLCSMLNSNEEYFQRMKESTDVCYWLKGKSVLLYSHPKGSRFFFADLLYGQNQDSFIGVNALINLTFPNSVIISSGTETHAPLLTESSGMEPIRPFFTGSALIPFDVLLTTVDSTQTDIPIYLNNLSVLLNKSISIDDSL